MHHLLTGSYSGPEEKGIKLWTFDPATGKLAEGEGLAGIDRPSFLAVHPTGSDFAAASETGNGELVVCRYNPADGTLAEVNRRHSNGDHPAHVSIDEAGKWLLSVNYSGGNVNVFPLSRTGEIGKLADSVKHKGNGPNPDRQDAPHPHSVSQIPGTDLFVVPDLGTDALYVYRLDVSTGKLSLQHKVPCRPGSGPRHVAFHPREKIMYVLGELDSSVTSYSLHKEELLRAGQTVSLVPEDWEGENTSAEVAVSEDGRFLYASNRGHDSIAAFSISRDGQLSSLGFAASGGKGPRHFALVPGGEWIVVANERSDSLSVLKLAPGGMPEVHGNPVATKAPVCVKLIGG
jgi:6-phosphogluconolactonase